MFYTLLPLTQPPFHVLTIIAYSAKFRVYKSILTSPDIIFGVDKKIDDLKKETEVVVFEDENEYDLRLQRWRELKESEYSFSGAYDKVPLFFQTDFDYIPYSTNTVYTSGCGITCAAMVASYINEIIYSPGEFGLLFDNKGNNNVERMQMALDYCDVSYEISFSWIDTKTALQNGQVVILLIKEGAETTLSDGHFVVLTGITDDGKILINDPYEPDYNGEYNRDGFVNGFDENTIINSFGGSWIIEKKNNSL